MKRLQISIAALVVGLSGISQAATVTPPAVSVKIISSYKGADKPDHDIDASFYVLADESLAFTSNAVPNGLVFLSPNLNLAGSSSLSSMGLAHSSGSLAVFSGASDDNYSTYLYLHVLDSHGRDQFPSGKPLLRHMRLACEKSWVIELHDGTLATVEPTYDDGLKQSRLTAIRFTLDGTVLNRMDTQSSDGIDCTYTKPIETGANRVTFPTMSSGIFTFDFNRGAYTQGTAPTSQEGNILDAMTIPWGPYQGKLAVIPEFSRNLWLVDPVSDQIVKTIPLPNGGMPKLLLADNAGRVVIGDADNELPLRILDLQAAGQGSVFSNQTNSEPVNNVISLPGGAGYIAQFASTGVYCFDSSAKLLGSTAGDSGTHVSFGTPMIALAKPGLFVAYWSYGIHILNDHCAEVGTLPLASGEAAFRLAPLPNGDFFAPTTNGVYRVRVQ